MDSMIGYKNEKYLNFGRAAAKFDDVMNFLPSRISAWMMIAAAPLAGLDAKEGRRIFKRDRRKHASPNARADGGGDGRSFACAACGSCKGYFGEKYDNIFGIFLRGCKPLSLNQCSEQDRIRCFCFLGSLIQPQGERLLDFPYRNL